MTKPSATQRKFVFFVSAFYGSSIGLSVGDPTSIFFHRKEESAKELAKLVCNAMGKWPKIEGNEVVGCERGFGSRAEFWYMNRIHEVS